MFSVHPATLAQVVQRALAQVKTEFHSVKTAARVEFSLQPEGEVALDTPALVGYVLLARPHTWAPWHYKSHHSPRPLQPTTHQLKCSPEYYQEVWQGSKTAELRFDDRGYQEGDILELLEWEAGGEYAYHDPRQYNGLGTGYAEPRYTGRTLQAQVTHLLRDFPGLTPGWVMLSLELL